MKIADAGRDLRWWASDYLYAAYWQVKSVVSRNSPEAYLGGDRVPVVVIPGVYETWRFMLPLIAAMHARQHPVHVIDLLRWNRLPVAAAADQVASYLQRHDLRDVVVVAHSKGGLIGKYAMTLGPAASRIQSMLAVAAPFAGSRYARFLFAPSLKMFRPADATVVALNAQATANSRIVSIYGRFDPHIPGGSFLAGAKNVQLDSGGHFRVLADPRVIAELELLGRKADSA